MNRRKIREMAARWAEDEDWDGKPTEALLADFGATVARMVRFEERDARLAALEPAGIPPPKRFRTGAAAALERKEHRR